MPSLERTCSPSTCSNGLPRRSRFAGRDADAEIADPDLDALGVARRHHAHVAAARRELDAVGEQVDQHLLHCALVRKDGARARADIQLQRDAAALGLELDETQRAGADLFEVEHLLEQLELARFDLGHVENAVDELQ